MTDTSSGADWSQGGFDHAGPGDTAEWIVEAPTDSATGNVETVASYDTPVALSGCGVTGTSAITAVTMEQNSVSDFSPGPYNDRAFTVTATTPATCPPRASRVA